MGIELTPVQQQAIKDATNWFNSQESKQIFTIAGYAGTGKTTVVNALIRELGLKPHEVRFCAFTGKASLVLSRKGNPASTIHKLIYDVREIPDPKKEGRKKIIFVKKPVLDPFIKLILVDEVSMVDKKLLGDLKSYGIKIIALGDPGQLPPIGEDNNLLKNPDVFLTEIHRQAEDSPIIYLSMLARKGQRIYPGMYGKDAVVINKEDITDGMLLGADQVLCGKNNTRQDLNAYIRELLGFKNILPTKGDKLICTRNNWNEHLDDLFLINGLIGYIESDVEYQHDEDYMKFNFRPEFIENDYFESIKGRLSTFMDPQDRPHIPYHMEQDKSVNMFDFGYAITVHKAQGSEFDNVLVYHEYFGPEMNNKWTYTAITRASRKLILAI